MTIEPHPLPSDRLPDPSPVPNRIWFRRARLSLVFLSILGNCLTAAGVAVFPLVAPWISHRFGLDQSKTNSIVVGGICGQYFTAALIGGFADTYGPRWTSLLSSLLNTIGYTSLTYLLSLPLSSSPAGSSPPPSTLPLALPIHLLLSLSYAFIGAGAISSYFSSLKASTLNFPSHPSLAIAIPLSAFGLSSAFLAALSSLDVFTDSERQGELDARTFSASLVFIVGGWNLFAAAGLRVMPSRDAAVILEEEEAVAKIPVGAPETPIYPHRENQPNGLSSIVDEETPLMGGKKMERGSMDLSLIGLLRDRSFWSLGLAMFLIIGPAEMFINSIGSIITSLLTPVPSKHSTSDLRPLATVLLATFTSKASTPSPLQIRQTHVQLISVTNTVSRLVTGFLADYLSSSRIPPPPPKHRSIANTPSSTRPSSPVLDSTPTDDDALGQHRRFYMSKVTMLLITVGFLTSIYLFGAIGLREVSSLWLLTASVGWAYGTLFTLTPTLTAQLLGLKTFGRNFGLLSYFVRPCVLSFNRFRPKLIVSFSVLYVLSRQCAISSLSFTYLYSSLADAHARRQQLDSGGGPPVGIPEDPSTINQSIICAGRGCFEGTMWIAVCSSVLGGVVLWWVGRGWKLRGI